VSTTGCEDCELCQSDGGTILWRDARLRIIAVNDPDIPAFLRVVWNAHVREMSDLDAADADHLMGAALAAERALRAVLAPDKINLASLGNVVPHLHWHVIPRYATDAHFPQPIWGVRQRDPDPVLLARQRAALPELRVALARALRSKSD
jgi:diadenosine tetraphosphate (Ap4A) HIT family hydrolase